LGVAVWVLIGFLQVVALLLVSITLAIARRARTWRAAWGGESYRAINAIRGPVEFKSGGAWLKCNHFCRDVSYAAANAWLKAGRNSGDRR
jgi:hypothetical protein